MKLESNMIEWSDILFEYRLHAKIQGSYTSVRDPKLHTKSWMYTILKE